MQIHARCQLRTFLIFFSTVFLTVNAGCTLSRMVEKGEAEQKITVEPSVLEISGNNVIFDIKAQIPAELTDKKAVYGLTLAYNYGPKQTEQIAKLRFATGEYIYENGVPTISRQFSFPYTPEKSRGRLLIQAEAAKPKGRTKHGKIKEIATGIITTSRLVVTNNSVWMAPDDYRKGISEPQTLTFFFDEGEAKMRDYLGTNVAVLQELVSSNYKIQSVDITAGHSPENADIKDIRLAQKRVQMFEKYIRHQFDVNSYVNSNNSVKFKTHAVVHNWDRFLKQIQLSALTPDQINEILTIVNSDETYEAKVKQLSQLNSYEYLSLYIYPTLRYADIRIAYIIPQKKDSEIYLLSKKIVENRIDSDQLTDEELRYAATLTPLLTEKLKIYQTAAENTLKWQAFNNLGVVYVQLAQQAIKPETREKLLKEAIINLTYASHRNPTAQLFYNLGSAQQLNGNYLEALRSYDYAIKLGGPVPVLQQVFAEKAALEIITGQLDEAVTSLAYSAENYQTLMNKALLYMLKGNYEQAQVFYQQASALKPTDALAHYCLAIIAARTNHETEVASQLREATRLQRELTAKAITDPEFIQYIKLPAFQAALK